MNCGEQRCSSENCSSRSLPASSISPNAYPGSAAEKRRAACASVIHPRSPASKCCNEDASALSLVADSLGASGGVAFAALKNFFRMSPSPIRATVLVPAARLIGKELGGQKKCQISLGLSGGARGSRTPDLLNAIQALSQLSYGPTRD